MQTDKVPIVHVSFQDPAHITGGQGVSTSNTCRAEMALGYPVDYVSLRISGELRDQAYRYPEGFLHVHRIDVPDSKTISTPYKGDEGTQYCRRVEFINRAVDYIKKSYDHQKVILHLCGFYAVPLMAGALDEYNVSTTYNLLLTPRMDITKERDPIHRKIRMLEVLSFYANRKIRAISPGMKEEILKVASELRDPSFKEEVMQYAKEFGIKVYGLEEAGEADLCLEDRIFTIPHGVGNEFLEVPRFSTIPGKVVAWGRISREKGFEYLIRVARYFPDKQFHIWGTIGDTERKRKEYKEWLISLREKLGLPNVQLEFVEGGIRGVELLRRIDSGEIVVMPSLYESLGLVNIEALARRKPIVTTTTAGGKLIMETDVPAKRAYGYVIGNDPDEYDIKEGIVRSLDDFFGLSEKQKEKMRKAAFERAKEFRWSRMLEDIIAMYNHGQSIERTMAGIMQESHPALMFP